MGHGEAPGLRQLAAAGGLCGFALGQALIAQTFGNLRFDTLLGNRACATVVQTNMKTLASPLAMALTVVIALLILANCAGDDTTVADGPDNTSATPPTADDGADEPLGAGPYPVGTLEVTITHPDADPVSYTISCLGDTATITPAVDGLNEQTACTALNDDAVRTLLFDGPPSDRVCTEIYGGPDEASITGTLDEQPVDVVITRNNGCGIDDWDSTLAGILPAALGVTG